MKLINTRPVTEQDLTPEEFLRLSKNKSGVIKSSRIIPPKLGENNFGKIRVVRKTPLYMTEEA